MSRKWRRRCAATKDETVLIVGHITVTGVIAALGGPRLPTICDNVFSDLFLFTPAAGDAGLLHLHYGAAEDISPRCRISRPVRLRSVTSREEIPCLRIIYVIGAVSISAAGVARVCQR